MKTKRKVTTIEEIFNAITHGIGMLLAVAALVLLVVYANIYGNVWHIVSFSIYGSTLIILYMASTLYHSFPEGRVKSLFKIFDHSSIYLLIAGTYTPLTLIILRGALGWTIFGIVWAIAIAGIIFKSCFINKLAFLSTFLYILMGWLIIIAIKPLTAAMNTYSLRYLFVGGILYTLGTIFYSLKRMKFNHVIWHLFVLAGSIFHFFAIFFLLPR